MNIQELIDRTDYTIEEILSENRTQDINNARQVIMYHLSVKGRDDKEIGKLVNRNRATVAHGVKRIKDLISINDKQTMNNLKLFDD